MDNSTIIKLINKISFELVSQFQLEKAKEMSFVPINMQKNAATGLDVFFVAVCKDSKLNDVKDYVNTIIPNEVSFIKMSSDDFEVLFDAFLKKYATKYKVTVTSFEEDKAAAKKAEADDDDFDDDFDIEYNEGDPDLEFDDEDDEDYFDAPKSKKEEVTKAPAAKEDDEEDDNVVTIDEVDEQKGTEQETEEEDDNEEEIIVDSEDDNVKVAAEVETSKPSQEEKIEQKVEVETKPEKSDVISSDEELVLKSSDDNELDINDDADELNIQSDNSDDEIIAADVEITKEPEKVVQPEVKKEPAKEVVVNDDSAEMDIVDSLDDELDISDDTELGIDDDSFGDVGSVSTTEGVAAEDDDIEADLEITESDVAEMEDIPEIKPQPKKEEPKAKAKDSDANPKRVKSIDQIQKPHTKKLGEILVEEGLIDNSQLEIALAESKVQGIPLGSTLVKLGFISMKDLKEALGAQMGLKYATSEQLKALTNAVSILPEDFVKMNKVIPLSMTDKSLVVGMVHPDDTKVINEIVYQTGLKPTVMLVTHLEFENFLSTYYSSDKQDADELLQQIGEDEDISQGTSELWDQVEEEIEGSDSAVSQLANKIITMSIDRRASDIHIEPMSVGYRVRLRIDGSLQEVLKIPAKVDSAVLSRFKVLSKMNIAEHRRAQDGSFTLKYKNRAQDFRVNTLPVAGREKMVIRVLAPQMDSKQAKADTIEVVGASEEDIRKITYLVSAPNGIVLTAGPTGSGKTTTLYALLRYMNADDVNITTIEDPVEIKLEGINQSAINHKAGITFANSLRAILRQDPDTILIGEIRDYETLEVAVSASLTGHLVLSTIHTNSAAASITRLIEMGAKDYLISSTVSGIIAQRLVKKLCPDCKEEYYPTVEEARKVLQDPEEVEKLTKTKLYRPKGCPNCKNSGYQGRLAVLEILVINNDIRKMIAQRCHDVELEEYAIKNGMKTLRMSCLRHILEGNTSIDEQVRILGLAGES